MRYFDPEIVTNINWSFWRKLNVMNRMRTENNFHRDSKHIQIADTGYCLDRYSCVDFKRNLKESK